MISAWSCRQNLVLGQAKVSAKTNEFTAIPRLLDLLTIKGATITIDAMGCQREIAAKIIEKEADYVLALKGNQGTLRDDVEEFFIEQKANKYRDCKATHHRTVDGDHGRIETRCQRRSNFPSACRSKSTSLTASKKAPDIGGLLACIVLFLGGFCRGRLGLA
ncbi:MAG: ISAs1 family transposase [Alphaproteobacteria bacterium]|nr:ISAs1 family transposase [Alphaproteobacteria bacterium]